MPVLPTELLHEAIKYLPPISSINPSKVFGYTLRDNHSKVWRAIFCSDEFASVLASEQGVRLVLLGNDIRRLYDDPDTTRQIEVCLALGCYNRDSRSKPDTLSLHAYNMLFQSSLQDHVLCGHGVVRLVKTNITLFVAENMYPVEPTCSYAPPTLWVVPEPSKLLSLEEGALQSVSLYWDATADYKYVTLAGRDIICPQGSASQVDYSDIYLLRLLNQTVVVFRSSLFDLSQIGELLSTSDYALDLTVPPLAHASHVASRGSSAPLSLFSSLWQGYRPGPHDGPVSPTDPH